MNSLIIVHIGCTFDSVPDKDVLLNLLADIKHLWHEIGLALQVPDEEIEGLRQENLSNIIKLSKILQYWINQCVDVTWQSIITAVRSKIVGKTQISQEIESYVYLLSTNPGGETPTKGYVACDVSTSSKKHSRVPVEPQRSKYSMLLK